MKTIEIEKEAGPDRVLHVDIPVDDSKRYHLSITITPVPNGSPNTPRLPSIPSIRQKLPADFKAHPSWPEGFWENVVGSWDGEFARDQGEYEQRETW